MRRRVFVVVALVVFGIPAYFVYRLYAGITFPTEIARCGGNVQLKVVGPQWYTDLVGQDYAWLLGTPTDFSAPSASLKSSDYWLGRLRGMTSLQTLGLDNSTITDQDLEVVENLPDLRCLGLEHTAISDAGLKHLRGLAKLETLYLSETRVTDRGLASLAPLSTLLNLNLRHTAIQGQGLASLSGMNGLWFLDLEESAIDDRGLESMLPLTGLKVLVLRRTKITDAGLRRLDRFPSLISLDLANTGVTDAALSYLEAATGLRVLELSRTRVSGLQTSGRVGPAEKPRPQRNAADRRRARFVAGLARAAIARSLEHEGHERRPGPAAAIPLSQRTQHQSHRHRRRGRRQLDAAALARTSPGDRDPPDRSGRPAAQRRPAGLHHLRQLPRPLKNGRR
jgi:Leucine Rich Repeat (LRR) protein